MKKFKLLTLALVLTLVGSLFTNFTPIKAADANGMWVLIGHREVMKEAVNNEYWSYDMNCDYNESEGKVTLTKVITLTNDDGRFESTFIGECAIPKSTVKPGEYLQVYEQCWVEGSNLDNMLCSNSCILHVYDFDVPFREVDNYSKRYISTGTGPNSEKQDAMLAEYDFPRYNPKDGDIFEIEFYQSSGNSTNGYMGVIWTYTYYENYQAAPAKASIKSAKVKKNTLTVTAKSIKCDGYQFQVSNYDDFRATTDTKFATVSYFNISNKVTFDNRLFNKTKYIRVRAFYKDGENLTFGEWSKVKKLNK